VKLSAGGRELTRPLTIIKDPHSGGTEADIQAQMTTLFELRRDMDRAADLVNQLLIERIGRLRDRLVVDDPHQRFDLTPRHLGGILLYVPGGARIASWPPSDERRVVRI
jgi:hypothetical protein